MRKLYSLIGLLGLALAGAFVSVPTPAQAAACIYQDAPPGFIRWGDSSNCYLLKVNSDGSINVTGSVSPSPAAVTPTNKGGTVTAGGTAQTLAASNSSRKVLTIQNPCTATGQGISAVEDLYISVTGSATVAGASNFADLPACASVDVSYNGTVITAAVSVNAATTGHRWNATEGQ